MIHTLYRICAKENAKVRPWWYSKALCFASLVDAQRRLSDATLTLLSDGQLPLELVDTALETSKVVQLHRSGNANSFLQAISIAITFRDDDIVYFVEDDYFHCADSLCKLRDVFHDCSCDYVTLYDHPDRYLAHDHRRHDAQMRVNTVSLSGSHHWRTVESTCMTFAGRVRTIRDDLGIFMTHVRPGVVPKDRQLFRHLQGLASFSTANSRRVLLGPIPSLATHCETTYLAPNVDWDAQATACLTSSMCRP